MDVRGVKLEDIFIQNTNPNLQIYVKKPNLKPSVYESSNRRTNDFY